MSFLYCVIALLFYYFHIISCIEKGVELHPVSCNGLDDGLHFIRPIVFIDNNINTEEIPSILVRCSNGWTIFDYSLDANIKHYFTSFMPITDDFGSMNVGVEHRNWPQWSLLKDTQFTVSDDCTQCAMDTNHDDIAYYMTGNYYQCSFATKSLCDMSPTTLQCNECSGLMHDDNTYPGLCTHIVLNIDDSNINDESTSHQHCVTAKWNYLPSIGLNGRFCPCFKPTIHQDMKTTVSALTITKNTNTNTQKRDTNSNCNKVIELTNDDFKYGTYRIKSCGIYKLMEHIIINMNAPSVNDNEYIHNPNDNDYWWPTLEQQQDNDEYPSDNFIGAYAMGFFAGISIETDDVVIDLNTNTLSMDYAFFIQQRFFSLIELGSKPFLSGQGPVNFGSNLEDTYPSNIVIKNGILGLTSHHGIHGNNNKNTAITDVKIIDFEVAGISMNGFDGLLIENVEIGPNYQQIPVTPQYAHARFMLQRLEYIADKEDTFVVINNEKVFVNDIIDTLRNEMDDAFRFSIDADGYEYDDDIYDNLFVNDDGLPHGATLYGLFLNSEGASVFGLGLSPGFSSNVILRNIMIKGLRSNPMETVRAQLQRGPFNDLLDMKRIVDFDNNSKYKGTSYSNAQYALSALVPDSMWSVLGHSFINKQITRWIEGKKKLQLHTTFKCNSDVMLHLSKGVFGIRIDNVDNVQIDGYLNVENIHNLGGFGEDSMCGRYFNAQNGGHHNQKYPEQIGYSGTEVHAVSFIGSDIEIRKNANIYINDILSSRGSCFGINFYKESHVHMDTNVNIVINNIHSGAYLSDDDVGVLWNKLLPNTVPRSCVIDDWFNDYDIDTRHIQSKCITGFGECSFKYSQIDAEYTKDNEILNRELMLDLINNEECVYNRYDDDGVLIQVLSQSSQFHLDSLRLLQMQSKSMRYHVMNKGVIDAHLYIIILFGAVIVIMLLLYCCWLRCHRKQNDNEYTPLISPL